MEIVNMIRLHEEKIQDVYVKYKSSSSDFSYENEWAYKAGKEYYIVKDTNNKRTTLKFDGQKQYLLTETDSNILRGAVKSLEALEFGVPFTPRVLIGFSLLQECRKPFSNILSQAKIIHLQPERETIDGHDCVVMEALQIKHYDFYFNIKAWIDVNRDYRPLKIEKYRDVSPNDRCINKNLIEKVSNIKLDQFKGLWFPVSGERQFFQWGYYLPDGRLLNDMSDDEAAEAFKDINESKIKSMLTEKLVVDRPKYKINLVSVDINKGIDDKEFQIVFPDGSTVWDNFLQTGYIVGHAK